MDDHEPRTECIREFEVLKGNIKDLDRGRTAMEKDITDIKKDISDLKVGVASLPGEVKGMLYDGLKWVLGTYLIGAMVCFFIVGGMSKQVEINTKKWDVHDQRFPAQTHEVK
jgi:hypothetical protein